MNRDFYLDLAAAGLRMPIGTHLVLAAHNDHDEIVSDGRRLGSVVEEAARRFHTPLAVPLMDLTLEKAALLAACGIREAEGEAYHFSSMPSQLSKPALSARMAATCEGIRHIARETNLVPIGMSIGPFSLTTKLLSDPITPVFLAGAGATGQEEPEVQLLERLHALASETILFYLENQIAAGAKAIIICEPAANRVYFSPNQLAQSYENFDRFVIEPNRRIRELLAAHEVDLIFHNCGELVEGMIRRFVTLDPAILSLGSSRQLWQDASLVPKSTVLFGNLPTKKFYSDSLISLDEVRRLTAELVQRMRLVAHPLILGSECDVLSVPGCESIIEAKVQAFLETN
jgi:uroporphyrinogen-III decarboxylase